MKKKTILILAGLTCLVLGAIVMKGWAFNKLVDSMLSGKVEVVKVDELNPKQTTFLDARTRAEYEVSHLPNAIWVGYDSFKIENLTIDPSEDVTVYCSLGKRSDDIAIKLKDAGYHNVKNLYGGIFQWVNDGNPVVNQAGPTTKIHGFSRTWGIWLNQGDKVY